MQHIACGLSPASIGTSPFTPLTCFAGSDASRHIDGWPRPVWLAPCISGFVGGDITSGMLAVGGWGLPAAQLFIDLGTNGEMALGCGGHIVTCATAAGPVFEGVGISQGMRATAGAIQGVQLPPTAPASAAVWPQLDVIGGGGPAGICGSGLVDAVALFLDLGLIDTSGQIPDAGAIPTQWHHLRGEVAGLPVCYLTPDRQVYLTQADVRNFQLAKTAIYAGICTLLDSCNLTAAAVQRTLIAGGLGQALQPASAVRSGLVPAALAGSLTAAGNTAIEGVSMALLSSEARQAMQAIAAQSSYLELSTSPVFNDLFMSQMGFEVAPA
jgi:uncharacterized 2Fe-2S/4Fe-4S cluster protein (DUF4445 family)